MTTEKQKTEMSPQPAQLDPGDDARAGTPGTGEDACRECEGTGRLNGRPCPNCGGTGVVVQGIGGA